MEAVVLSGNQTDSELLISLDLLIEWNLVPKNFPNITLDEHFKQLMTNKHFNRKYSSPYTKQSEEFSQSLDNQSDNQYEIPKPPKACSRLKEKLLEKHSNVFKEKLSPSDRIRAPPIWLKIDRTKDVSTRAHTRPYDIPFNLREPMQAEISDAIEAGVLTPCNSHSK